jgi:hypothetical protein
MTNTLTTYRRRGGVALLTGAALTGAGCIWAAVAQATGHVPSDLFRYPLSHGAVVPFALLAACAHACLLAGVLWLRRSGLPQARAITGGLGAVVVGTAVLVVCEFASIPVADQLGYAYGASWVWIGFAVASLFAVFGMLTAGLSISAHTSDPTWRDHAPLICGLLSLVVLPLESTNILWLGVALYAVGYGMLAAALLTAPAERRQAVAQPA